MENLIELILSVVVIALALTIYLYANERKERKKLENYLYRSKAPRLTSSIANVEELKVDVVIGRNELTLAPSLVNDRINQKIALAVSNELIERKLIERSISADGNGSPDDVIIRSNFKVITD